MSAAALESAVRANVYYHKTNCHERLEAEKDTTLDNSWPLLLAFKIANSFCFLLWVCSASVHRFNHAFKVISIDSYAGWNILSCLCSWFHMFSLPRTLWFAACHTTRIINKINNWKHVPVLFCGPQFEKDNQRILQRRLSCLESQCWSNLSCVETFSRTSL